MTEHALLILVACIAAPIIIAADHWLAKVNKRRHIEKYRDHKGVRHDRFVREEKDDE